MPNIKARQRPQPPPETQLEFDFMRDMPQQLSPAVAAKEFAAYRKAFGGERAGNITVIGSSQHGQ
jgi:hypothetical protein